jgi:hypothetical protein
MIMNALPRDKVVVGGLYRHFKGALYRVVDLVHNSEDWDQHFVVYYDIDEPKEHRFARPVDMFCEEVEKVEHNYKGPRFQHVPGNDDPEDWKGTSARLAKAYLQVQPLNRAYLAQVAGLTELEVDALQRAVLSCR